MEKKNIFYLCASFCLLIAITIGASNLRKAEEVTALSSARMPASIKGSNSFLLTKKELMALNEKDLEKYLRGVAKIIAKVGKRNPKLMYGSSIKTSQIWVYLENEAYAADPEGCLIGFSPAGKEDCKERRGAISLNIKEGSANKFTFASDDKKSVMCPAGQQMCSPAIYGFKFKDDGKAELICLRNASGQECYDKISTKNQGDRLKKSLALLGEVNPEYWDELGESITQMCKPKSGGATNDRRKTDCALLKKQLALLAKDSRGGLKEYKNLKALINGESDSLAGIDGSTEEVPEALAGDGKARSCHEVKKAYESQTPSNLSVKHMAELRTNNNLNADKDGLTLLRHASIVCNKSLEKMVGQYGVCNKSITNKIDSLRPGRIASAAVARKAKNDVLRLVSKLPKSVRDQLTPRTSMLRVRALLDGASKSEESNEAYDAWKTFYDANGMSPLKAIEQYQNEHQGLFTKVLNNSLNGGVLTEQQRKYLVDFRHNFGMEVEEIKGLFCPNPAKDTFQFGERSKSNGNWKSFTTECLKQMGFGHRGNSLTVSLPALDNNNVVQNSCEWKTQSVDNILGYFNGTVARLADNIFIKKKNGISRQVKCLKLESCEYTRGIAGRGLPHKKRGLLIDGQCISNSAAVNRLSSEKENISNMSCTNKFRNNEDRVLSPAEMIERDRGIN